MIRFFFVIAILIGLQSCKKEEVTQPPVIADIPYSLFAYKTKNDTSSSQVQFLSKLVLKKDFTWTLDFGGAKSNGSYTWHPTSQYQAHIKFSITNWTPLKLDAAASEKLKSILLTVDNCLILGSTLQSIGFQNKDCTVNLTTAKQ